MTVFGLDFTRLQDQQAELVFQGAVVVRIIELTMFGQHEAIKRQRLLLDPLTIVLDFGPAVVRGDGM